MTQYRVAYNADTQVATITLPEHDLPDGSEDVGQLNISSVSPNPTDASTQHITTMLQRKGYSSFDHLTITVDHESVASVIEQKDLPTSAENGEALADAIIPGTLEVPVGETVDLFEGKKNNSEVTSGDDEIVKVTKNGSVKGLKAGAARLTVTTKAGVSNDVVVTVVEAQPSAPVATKKDAKEAAPA